MHEILKLPQDVIAKPATTKLIYSYSFASLILHTCNMSQQKFGCRLPVRMKNNHLYKYDKKGEEMCSINKRCLNFC